VDGPGGFFSPVIHFNITSVNVPEPAAMGFISILFLGGQRRRAMQQQ